MKRPRRIQRRRAKGWTLPPNTVCVDRSTKWDNPFVVGEHGTRAECVQKFQALVSGFLCLTGGPPLGQQGDYLEMLQRSIGELKGKHLACWCGEGPCHGRVLLEIANGWKSKDPVRLERIT